MSARLGYSGYGELFDIDPGIVYLDHCVIGPLPKRAHRAASELTDAHARFGSGGFEDLPAATTFLSAARDVMARLIGARPSEVAFVKNTVEGLAVVANGIRWEPGDNVVVSRIEFPANRLIWENLQDLGVEVKLVEATDGRVRPEDYLAQIDERTRVLAVSFVQFDNGFRVDLPQLGAICREHGVFFVVDAIQGVGALRLDVEACGIDFLAAGGHKWMLSPIGSGIAYCRTERLDDLRIAEIGHLSVVREGDDYTRYRLEPRPDASRFEGGVCNLSGIAGLKASAEVLLDVGMDVVEERILALTDMLVEGAQARGYRVASPREKGEASGIVSIQHPSLSGTEVHDRLRSRGVTVSKRADYVRLAPHFHNTERDIQTAIDALKT